jgi:hypothetical protein
VVGIEGDRRQGEESEIGEFFIVRKKIVNTKKEA